jgi:hypothetical protein
MCLISYLHVASRCHKVSQLLVDPPHIYTTGCSSGSALGLHLCPLKLALFTRLQLASISTTHCTASLSLTGAAVLTGNTAAAMRGPCT